MGRSPAWLELRPARRSGGPLRRQVEAHLVGFEGDLYGQTLRVEVLDWWREQRKYDGLEPLMEQIRRDIDWTVRRAGLDAARQIARVGTGATR